MNASHSRLANFPVTLFGATMGLSGLTMAVLHAQQHLSLSPLVFNLFTGITLFIFFMITTTYLIKFIKYPQAVKAEFNHPISANFFSSFSISLLLLSLIVNEIQPTIALYMWSIGSVIQLALTIRILSSWIHHDKWQIQQMNPAWFIPIVGNIMVPLGAVHFADIELGWFFFSIGLVFWIILQVIIMYRLFFHPPMPQILEPFLFIFIAPPAMGFLAYFALNGHILDEFARILYYTALFFTLLLFSQLGRFAKIPFALTWWAYTFPIAAITNASFTMYETLHYGFYLGLAYALLAVLCVLVVLMTFKTLLAIKNKQLCVPPATAPKPTTQSNP